MALALEMTDHINEVFEDARSGDAPVLRHMTDEKDRHIAFLRRADQGSCDRTDLGDTSRATIDLRGLDCLHRVDEQERGLDSLHMPEDRGQVVVVGEEEAFVDCTNAFCTGLHLGRGL